MAGPAVDMGKAERVALALGAIDSIKYASQLVIAARQRKDYARAIQLTRLGFAADSSLGHEFDLILLQSEIGPIDSVRAILARIRAVAPGHPLALVLATQLATMTDDDSSALAITHTMEAQPVPLLVEWGAVIEAAVLQRAGRLKEARRAHQLMMQVSKVRGVTGTVRQDFIWDALGRSRLTGDSVRVVALLDSALALDPWNTSMPRDRDYGLYVQAAAEIHRPDLARRTLALRNRDDPTGSTLLANDATPLLESVTLSTEAHYAAAIDSLRSADRSSRATSAFLFALLGRIFDAAGQRDSAPVYYGMEKYLHSTSMNLWLWVDCDFGVPLRTRVGELYAERGDGGKAREMYALAVKELRNADPELQGIVADLRARIRRLGGG